YAKRNEIKCPDFIIHDRMETAHQNQMKTIFEIASSLDGQYILPILKEKVKTQGYLQTLLKNQRYYRYPKVDDFLKYKANIIKLQKMEPPLMLQA
ncbi:hypothetical protein, partial [Eubacterium aggregans]|uniref:hypothetical protein n=1 Tax=Eubacterium aggregans TaxID=81409 RepID=UPI003F345CDC